MTVSRDAQLQCWVAEKLGCEAFPLTLISGDASFRRYFRGTHQDISYIAVDAPPDKEDNPAFVKVANALEASGLQVPHVFAADYTLGFMLLSDLGDDLYLNVLDENNAEHLYTDAIRALVSLQQCQALNAQSIPHFDADFIRRELALFTEWFLPGFLSYNMNESEQASFEKIAQRLIAVATTQPQVCVHRDYHSRNLLLCPAGNPGIIDFQDAVWGPITYDLVSLLRDSYIVWPKETVTRWCRYYLQTAQAAGLLSNLSFETFQMWFDYVGLQRNLKILGIFARLSLRDGKHGYLQDMPRTLNYALDVCSRYDELQPLYQFLQAVEQPLQARLVS